MVAIGMTKSDCALSMRNKTPCIKIDFHTVETSEYYFMILFFWGEEHV